MFFYLPNLRSATTDSFADPLTVHPPAKPAFASKAAFRDWCSKPETNHVFYSLCEGDAPTERISGSNPIRICHGAVADYDAPVDWGNLDVFLSDARFVAPTYYSTTQSGYIRLVWLFEEPMPVDPETYEGFITEIHAAIKSERIFAGFDRCSLAANQYFEFGADWVLCKQGAALSPQVVQAALLKAASKRAPQSADTSVPMEIVAQWVEEVYPGRWRGTFEVGARGPLFWLDDGVTRDGCQVTPDGMVCFSDRAARGFLSWRDLFGAKRVESFETTKLGSVLDEYWYDGKSFFKMIHDSAVAINREQLVLELRKAGFSQKIKKGQPLSEVESTMLTITNHNRIHAIAPVVFSADRVVHYNGNRILNSATVKPVAPAGNGDPANWPFLHEWLSQLFHNSLTRPTTDYFYSWLARLYKAMLEHKIQQGQALLLVGPTGRGKSLLSNKVISGLVGGFADASDYLTGKSIFNRDLARVAAWVVDDTTSASSFMDQLKATELIKRAVANPRIEYRAMYCDGMDLPWAGRVVLSLNMDPNSLSVVPAMDSSNRDKLMAMLISSKSRQNFPPNDELEAIIAKELPYFGRFLLDWRVPAELAQNSRYGVVSYLDEAIASAAYDNSPRSAIAEMVEFFVQRFRKLNEGSSVWVGTLTDFQVALHDCNNGRQVGASQNLEFVRRGMATMEEASKNNRNLRPIKSSGNGGGKQWVIDLAEAYDIANIKST